MFLVLIETSGNQNYIFSTNKLKENVGASELTYRVGTKWILEAIAAVDTNNPLGKLRNEDSTADIISKEFRKSLLDPLINNPLENDNSDFKVEIILAASGTALLLTKEEKTAQDIISKVTLHALKDAPGIEVSGVFDEFDWEKKDNKQSITQAIKKIHEKFEVNKTQIPSSLLRFQRLPFFQDCAFSGLPASGLEINVDGYQIPNAQAISKVCQLKRNFKLKGFDRVNNLLKSKYEKCNFSASISKIEPDFFDIDSSESPQSSSSISWMGVIHADGNGLGQIFINFGDYLKSNDPDFDNRHYINELRKFSLALDDCTEKAFLSALAIFKPNEESIPIFPLILGGDDLTVVCEGKLALPFTKKFLEEFEIETRKNETVSRIAKEALNDNRLSACAGVAIVKPHFPFSVAYELAEALAKSAKTVKQKVKKEKTPYPCSAIDFHVVYDSSGVELDRIRKKLEVDEGKTKLYLRPYVVTSEDNLKEVPGKDWINLHHWKHFQKRVTTLKKKNREKKPCIPNSQISQLRESLFLGHEIADHRYSLIKHRYIKLTDDNNEHTSIEYLEGDIGSLFIKSDSEKIANTDEEGTSESKTIFITGLLDAIEAADFLIGQE